MTTPRRPPTRVYRALCPICGRSGSVKLADPKDPEAGTVNLFDYEREPRPLGYVQEFGGRGSITTGQPFGPDDDPQGYFPLIKHHLLSAVREWHERGWITDEELASL